MLLAHVTGHSARHPHNLQAPEVGGEPLMALTEFFVSDTAAAVGSVELFAHLRMVSRARASLNAVDLPWGCVGV